jgi:hypothetical protein
MAHSLTNNFLILLIYSLAFIFLIASVLPRLKYDSGHLKLSPIHKMWGEAFGVVCWVWIFHRARHDGPVVLGWRHPWDHVEDPWKVKGETLHPEDEKDLEKDWDGFLRKVSCGIRCPENRTMIPLYSLVTISTHTHIHQ